MRKRPTREQIDGAFELLRPANKPTWIRCTKTRHAVTLALKFVADGAAPDEAAARAARVCSVDGPSVHWFVLERIESPPVESKPFRFISVEDVTEEVEE